MTTRAKIIATVVTIFVLAVIALASYSWYANSKVSIQFLDAETEQPIRIIPYRVCLYTAGHQQKEGECELLDISGKVILTRKVIHDYPTVEVEHINFDSMSGPTLYKPQTFKNAEKKSFANWVVRFEKN